MFKKTNLHDLVLAKLRDEHTSVTLFTTNGFQIKGRIAAFDRYMVAVESIGTQRFVYRNAISTFEPAQPLDLDRLGDERHP